MLSKRAEAGIGTLILFIAMILVAAIAAGVLIQTANSLQSRALMTGSAAQSQVSTQAMAVYFFGKDASSPNPGGNRVLNVTFLKLKLAPGSDAININNALIQVDTATASNSLVFDDAIDCDQEDNLAGGIFNDSGTFGVKYLLGTDDGYLKRTDVVDLCFPLPHEVGEGADLRVNFVPRSGSPTVLSVRTPDIMLNQQIQLYP